MAWLYIPNSLRPACSPESADTNSLSDWQVSILEHSCTWRGNFSLSKSWLKRWSRTFWLQRLCGMMLPPSTAARCVENWISSQPPRPASPTPSPENAPAMTTNAPGTMETALSRILSASLANAAQLSFFSKTSPAGSPEETLTPSALSCNDWITAARSLSSSLLKILAPLTNANGSGFWPTMTALSGGPESRVSKASRDSGGIDLQTRARNWQTPATDSFRSRGGERKDEMGLDQQAKNWATPNEMDSRLTPRDEGLLEAHRKLPRWKNAGCRSVAREAMSWPTVTAADSEQTGSRGKADPTLNSLSRNWPTIRADEYKGTGPQGSASAIHRLNPCYLDATAEAFPFTRHDQTTLSTGIVSSLNSVSPASPRRYLNPRFVEHLMGMPFAWTLSAPSATALFPSWLRSHSALCSRLCAKIGV